MALPDIVRHVQPAYQAAANAAGNAYASIGTYARAALTTAVIAGTALSYSTGAQALERRAARLFLGPIGGFITSDHSDVCPYVNKPTVWNHISKGASRIDDRDYGINFRGRTYFNQLQHSARGQAVLRHFERNEERIHRKLSRILGESASYAVLNEVLRNITNEGNGLVYEGGNTDTTGGTLARYLTPETAKKVRKAIKLGCVQRHNEVKAVAGTALSVTFDLSLGAALSSGGSSNGGPGPTGGAPKVCCFPAGTKITMEDGSLMNIEDVKVGDMVLSYDEARGEVVPSEVLELESPVREGYFVINNGLLRVTDEHPIFIRKADGRKGWASFNPSKSMEDSPALEVMRLEIGDEINTLQTQTSGSLLTMTQLWVKLTSATFVKGNVQTYNLKTIKDYHTFFADSVLVHNKAIIGCFIKGTRIKMANGSQEKIEQIKVGETVKGFDTKRKKWRNYPVTERQVKKNSLGFYLINKALKVSPVHRICVNGKSKTATELTLGDTLSNGRKRTRITSIELVKKKADRHNIVLGRNAHVAYLADGILVMNGW